MKTPAKPPAQTPVIGIGALFYSVETQRCLYLLRSQKQKNTWGLVGGKQIQGECIQSTLYREFVEEIGQVPMPSKLIPIETFTSETSKFIYYTYMITVDEEFVPILNDESAGYCWVNVGFWPKPLHNGAKNLLYSKSFRHKLDAIIAHIHSEDYDRENIAFPCIATSA